MAGNGRVGWLVGWCGEGAFFDGEVAVEVDLGGLDFFVAEPEGDDGYFYAGAK